VEEFAMVINGGVGYGDMYAAGQIDPMMPAAETVEVGGLVRLITPIWLL
jgi:hypothetical protein